MSPSDELFDPTDVEDLFQVPADAPLAVRMRPSSLDEVLGQDHLLGKGKLLRRTLESDRLSSLILYGPPGSGKTTLALIIAKMTAARYVSLNAVLSNVAEVRKVQEEARRSRKHSRRKTVLFIDEIHRFNKAQQDILMPDVETGVIILIGATTQNPSFAIRGPLLSRSLVCELKPLEEQPLICLMESALRDGTRGYGQLKVVVDPEALRHIARQSSGDARRALNALEVGVLTTAPDQEGVIRYTAAVAEESCQKKIVHYDWDEDFHYDTISAFIKSLRGSDVDAAVYWLAKMLYAGEDPRFILRRLLIFASEDIGNADPQALILASSGLGAVEFVGMPESRIILSQLVTYLALAPKSNASYMAIERATEDIKSQKTEQVPQHLRSAAYPGAETLGHGKGYIYPHDHPGKKLDQVYLGKNARYYPPVSHRTRSSDDKQV
ncbi:MAG: replication-associated recombination protein A [Candidatus Omnitrophica bacterium]|nr:replication-associated recombination protein A [Candidatus Omnitrophota bacterium]